MHAEASAMDGVLVIDKPSGPTSHDVVSRVRRATGTRRVGHTGTLDPIASGVLPLVIGRAARLARFLGDGEKHYDALIRLGLETDTYDVTGRPTPGGFPDGVERLSPERVEEALRGFRGTFRQAPPPFSAKKVDGTRAYRLARRGMPLQLPPSTVRVSRLELADLEGDLLRLEVTCSPGFYVRALAHELGAQLGTGACLQSLRRVRSGEFALDRAASLEAVEQDIAVARDCLVPMSSLLNSWPGVTLTSQGARRAACGGLIRQADLAGPAGPFACRVRLFDQRGQLIALAEPTGDLGALHPLVVVV